MGYQLWPILSFQVSSVLLLTPSHSLDLDRDGFSSFPAGWQEGDAANKLENFSFCQILCQLVVLQGMRIGVRVREEWP